MAWYYPSTITDRAKPIEGYVAFYKVCRGGFKLDTTDELGWVPRIKSRLATNEGKGLSEGLKKGGVVARVGKENVDHRCAIGYLN